MIDILKKAKETEPVRLYLYSVLASILALLVLKGVLSGDEMTAYLVVAATVLGVPAIEKTRSVVDSPSTAKAKQEALEAEHELAQH